MRLCLAVLAALGCSAGAGRGPVPPEFPRDHFDHPGFRTEWWYYTGNVRAGDGHRYGFELVFFRQAAGRVAADNPSAWRVDSLYLAHLALTDIDRGRFRYYERLNRAGPGIAGVSFAAGRIWNGNWVSQWDLKGNAQTLSVVAEGIHFKLRLTPRKGPVLHGENGLSRKGAGVDQASYYVSFTRLGVEGELNGAAVSGQAWMDHEWFNHSLEPDQRGWDWFSAQLDDGAEIMLFQIRRMDGGIDPYSSGTYVARDGRTKHLTRADFTLQPLAYWASPKTGARYPVQWRIAIPGLKVALDCAAAIPGQELASEANDYWEGAVTYRGSAAGVGYLEMTGYAKPVRM